MFKNLLVEYEGGGYDGCFWEYNYFMFDSDGRFVNLFTSGYAGVKDESQARKKLSDYVEFLKLQRNINDDPDSYFDHRRFVGDHDRTVLVNLKNPKSVKQWANATNGGRLLYLASKKWELAELLICDCYECGETCLVSDMHTDEYDYRATDLYCEDCVPYHNDEDEDFDTFYNAYLEAMTFTDFHEDNPDLVNSFGFSDEFLLECRQDCEKFLALVGDRLSDFSRAGHDFWLTRNGHGSGFWDKSEIYGQDFADELTVLCGYDGIFKPVDLYAGDDNLVYGS